MTTPIPPREPEARAAAKRFTIAVDFDGVIHSYSSPWVAEDVIPDPPVPGAIEWLNRIADDFDIVIFTTRGKNQAGRNAVGAYLREHGCELSYPITAEKPMALVYLDDRALRFDGSNFPTAQQVHQLKPWNKR